MFHRLAMPQLVFTPFAFAALAVSPASAFPAPRAEYVFVPVPDQLICHQWGPRRPLGTIDASGRFNVEKEYTLDE